MLMSRRQVALAMLATGLSPLSSFGDPLPDLIARYKPSVVLVGSYGLLDSPRFGFRGTGFVVGDGRTVVTNAHVLPPEVPGRIDRRTVVQVWTGEGQWQMREAKVLAKEPARDLALLQFDGAALPALPLARAEPREGLVIALIGFPLGGALGFSHVTHKGIVAARTAIAEAASSSQALNERRVRQLRDGVFDVLQLDANAYPGNSGGPVFSVDDGSVVGVVSMVVVKGTKEAAIGAASGITYAVPAREVAALLERAGPMAPPAASAPRDPR